MSAPQRVNVMLSRARNALLIIGNPDTFTNSRKGRDVWVPLMDKLKADGHVYNGFPVKCEQHPGKTALLTEKEHFDTVCPDGGCSEPWYVTAILTLELANSVSGKLLGCELHPCPYRCHQLQDHSKMKCIAIVSSVCPNNHKITRKCHNKAASVCQKCEDAIRAQEKRRQREHQLDEERKAKQRAYLMRLIEIEDEMEHQKRLLRDRAEEADREAALAQKRQDLKSLKNKVASPSAPAKSGATVAANSTLPAVNQIPAPATVPVAASAGGASPQHAPAQSTASNTTQQDHSGGNGGPAADWGHSDAKDDWEHQKKFDGAENEALDKLMPMIGKNIKYPNWISTEASNRSGVSKREVSCYQEQGRYTSTARCPVERGAVRRSPSW